MSLDSLSPIAPARVKALLLPIGQIKKDRFTTFVQRLKEQHVVQLRDITADSRPNRNMFSPLAFPSGAIIYDLATHVPPPSHLALSPFEMYREPMVILAIADGQELEQSVFSKRQSASANAPTTTERNIRMIDQELENLRDVYPKALAYQALVFDYESPSPNSAPIPEGIKTIPPIDQLKTTTMKTIMCDISALFLAEMTTLAKSVEAITAIDSPGQAPARPQINGWTASDDSMAAGRRNSQFSLPSITRSASIGSEKAQSRMSMPVPFKPGTFGSSNSSPGPRPTTPVRSGLSNPPTTFDDMSGTNGVSGDAASPEPKTLSRPDTADTSNSNSNRSPSKDRVSVQGFGSGGLNEKWRNKGKGRVTIVIGSLYLQAGRWTDALKELIEGATVSKSLNDHLWHGKALDLIVVCLILLGWAGVEFQTPSICLNPSDKSLNNAIKAAEAMEDSVLPKHLRNFQVVVPDILDRVVGLYTRVSGEQLPPLALSESIIRFCNVLTVMHIGEGRLDSKTLGMMVLGHLPTKALTTSPRLTIQPTRMYITNLLVRAFPSSTAELLTTVDRVVILSGISAIFGCLGYNRKKAMVVRDLISVLISGLVEARTRGAAEVGIHPAAGLMALNASNGHGNGAGALELGEGDIEYGVDAFLGMLGKTYGVVGFEGSSGVSAVDDTDAHVISRIQTQSATRNFGLQHAKINVLRACIHFSEALPDFSGVLRFSSDLLRTAGSGVAPGPRREDAAPMITREEQIRLATNILKTSSLAKRLGLEHLTAEYWDEFLVRGVTLDPLPLVRKPVPHAKTVLPGNTKARTSQDVNPFIYNPFLRANDKATMEPILVAGEPAVFRVTLQNPFDIDVEIESVKLETEGADFVSAAGSTVLGAYRTQILKLSGTPKEAGSVRITGVIIHVKGCRERRFPIFSESWASNTEIKIKGIGLSALEKNKSLPPPGPTLQPDKIGLSVIDAQPVVAIKSTTVPQNSVMILEGERQVFSVTLQNLSATTPADLLLFSFQDSTQGPVQTALSNRDATPAELYECELILAKKQALRLRKIDDSKRYIAPNSSATFDFEILGKPGLTNGTIQVDYGYLGVSQSDVTNKFHTRQVCLDLTVTVNASIELTRMDILPLRGTVSRALWHSLRAADDDTELPSSTEHCLLMMDLRNAWPSDVLVHLEAEGVTIEEHILPGNTSRILFPIPRIYLEDPHASIPALNPSRQRQFVVSSSKITPDIERNTREAFWYREKILDTLRGSWKTLTGTPRQGTMELRGIRLTPRMIEVVKIDEVGIEISVEKASEKVATMPPNTICVDDFVQIRVHLENRTDKPIFPTVRLQPSLCHRPLNVALDFTRKFAWNGTLQQHLPLLEAKSGTDFLIGATALCRGEFEITASVEETQLWTAPAKKAGTGRQRSETQIAMDAVLGAQERRMWHSRQPCLVRVRDYE